MKKSKKAVSILYRRSSSIAFPVTFDGVNDFAQSNDVLAKTAYNATVTGAVTIGSDSDGSFMNFTGSTGIYTQSNIAASGIDNSDPMTVIVVAKPTNFTANRGLCSIGTAAASRNSFRFDITTGKLFLELSGTTGSRRYTTTNSFTAGALAVVGYRVNSSFNFAGSPSVADVDIFSSGAIQAVTTATVGGSSAVYTNVNIGCLFSTSNNFLGGIYAVKVYNRALTDAEMAVEMANRKSPSVLKGAVVIDVNASHFAGTTSTPTSVYDSKAFTQFTPHVIVGTYDADVSGPIIGTPYSTAFGTLTTGVHTLCVSYAYVNGALVTKGRVDGALITLSGEFTTSGTKITDYIQLGKQNTTFFDGQIFDGKVYVGTITDAEGVELSKGNSIPLSKATLLAYPRLLPPSTTAMTDVSGNGYNFTLTT